MLTFGTAAIGILAAGAFNVWDDPAVVAIVFMGVTPLLSGIVLVIWAGEYLRRARAGRHLERLERAMRTQIQNTPHEVMAWESTLFTAEGKAWQRHFQSNYQAVVALFAALGLGSLAIGAYRGFESSPHLTVAASVIAMFVLIGLIGFVEWQILGAPSRGDPAR